MISPLYENHIPDLNKDIPQPLSKWEAMFGLHLATADIKSFPVREYKFHPDRKWKFDYAWPEQKLAVELEGATWSGGRHVTPKGFENDCEKYNHAALMGWKVLRFTGDQIKRLEAIKLTREALND